MAKSTLTSIIDNVVNTTRADEPLITGYDTLAEDGDCGETLLNVVNGNLAEWFPSTKRGRS